MNEFPPRSQVGCDDRASLRVGLEDRLAQRFIRVRRKNGESRASDQPVALIAIHPPDELHVRQIKFRRHSLQITLVWAIAGDHQMQIRESLHGVQQVIHTLLQG